MGGPSVARPSQVRSKTWDKGTRALVPKGSRGGTQPTIPEAGCDAYPCEPISRELPYSVPFKLCVFGRV
jgi:hypothetical protein